MKKVFVLFRQLIAEDPQPVLLFDVVLWEQGAVPVQLGPQSSDPAWYRVAFDDGSIDIRKAVADKLLAYVSGLSKSDIVFVGL